jgi:hypothetical protein
VIAELRESFVESYLICSLAQLASSVDGAMLIGIDVTLAFVLHTWQSSAEAVASALTGAAIVVGGFWAYWRFVRERTRWPRGNLEMSVTHRRLDEELSVLHAKIRMRNVGRGLMKLEEIRVDLQRVRPLDDGMRQAIGRGKAFTQDGGYQAAWPLIEQHRYIWDADKPQIEPGESDEFAVDFFIAPSEEVVFVYGYLRNVERKKGYELGWGATAFHDVEHVPNR